MGSVVGTAANGAGTLLGDAVAAPFRAVFGASCEGVCSGTWDAACFLEHLCVASLARLLMVLLLSYLMLFFVYLMCKVGIVQCVAKNACKMSGAACCGCCRAVGGASCFLWRRLRDTKRVYHGRRGRRPPDVEAGAGGWGSDDEEESGDGDHGRRARWSRAREGSSSSVRERKKDMMRRSLRLRRLTSHKEQYATARSHGGGGRHHRLRTVGLDLGRVEMPSTSLRAQAGRKFKRVRT